MKRLLYAFIALLTIAGCQDRQQTVNPCRYVYTDGLNEAEDPEQQQFGDDHLLDVLRHTHFDSAKQVVKTLNAKIEEHRNGAEPNDDLTMLCLRVS